MDYTVTIGGEAGQGIQTIGDLLSEILASSGLYVFTNQDYESRIRGGHNFYQIRISEKEIGAPKRGIDILLALDAPSINLHEGELKKNGQVLYDSRSIGNKIERPNFLDVPLEQLAKEAQAPKVSMNVVAVGALCGMLGIQLETLEKVIEKTFSKKGQDIIKRNALSARKGYDYAKTNCKTCVISLPPPKKPKILISGNEAIAIGAIASGLKFYSGYPMTPSTGILNFIADNAERFRIVVEQAEDEISAINMVIGASFAGVRSMTATSGGGFALMVEGLSLAAMTETPIVVVLAQRPGPATGLPTRYEASDLLFSLFAGHGEFLRIVFAPKDPKEALYLTNKAFDLSEKYQVPAIILTDQYLADSKWSYDSIDLGSLVYRDYRLRGDKIRSNEFYMRHRFTENGVSPFAVPGDSHHLVITDSDEHDEEGHISEDRTNRIKMVEKRNIKKAPLIRTEMGDPKYFGDPAAKIVFLSFGSISEVLREAVLDLGSDYSFGMYHFCEIFPMDAKREWARSLREDGRTLITVEQNSQSQLAKYLRMELGIEVKDSITRFDGRPFTVDELKEEIIDHYRRL